MLLQFQIWNKLTQQFRELKLLWKKNYIFDWSGIGRHPWNEYRTPEQYFCNRYLRLTLIGSRLRLFSLSPPITSPGCSCILNYSWSTGDKRPIATILRQCNLDNNSVSVKLSQCTGICQNMHPIRCVWNLNNKLRYRRDFRVNKDWIY